MCHFENCRDVTNFYSFSFSIHFSLHIVSSRCNLTIGTHVIHIYLTWLDVGDIKCMQIMYTRLDVGDIKCMQIMYTRLDVGDIKCIQIMYTRLDVGDIKCMQIMYTRLDVGDIKCMQIMYTRLDVGDIKCMQIMYTRLDVGDIKCIQIMFILICRSLLTLCHQKVHPLQNIGYLYTPPTLRTCCSQSKFRILKIRESSARALFLYNCTPNISRSADASVNVA